VRADPGQLESALLNIAINARDAMPGGGTLRFRGEFCAILPETVAAEVGAETPADRFVAIAIEDSGSGMTADARERAFEPFFTTKEAGRGTGLGLSTVYGFARQSRGAVTLESTLGRGNHRHALSASTALPSGPRRRPRPSPTGRCRRASECCWSRTMPRCAG
jgi:signal transduction histidine kinase